VEKLAAWAKYHRLRIDRAREAFEKRQFTTHVFDRGSEAADFFFSEISPDETIGYGGSETVTELGVRHRLRDGDYRFVDRSLYGHGYNDQLDIRRQTLSADVFVASSNAVSIEGALVNIDGDGNRIAGLSLGPKRVVLFIGRSKLCETLDQAIFRARNVAAPALAIQHRMKTPCAASGRCHDCSSPERICQNLSIIERCHPPGRIQILFINEDLGL